MVSLSRINIVLMILFLSIATVISNAEAHQGSLKGKVIDFVTKEPLENASIYIPFLSIGATTDKDGMFQLQFTAPIKAMVVIS
jgi:hypothetical protein